MRKSWLLAVAGVAITVVAMSAPQTFNISFGGDANSNASSAESDTIKSIGRGVGVNETEALKDAYRDAIERAIGLYVDAETVAKNDEIVKDQILTLSNAYITHYDKLKTTNISGGLVEVRIVATVKKRALIAKVSEAMPSVNFSLGSRMQDLYANITTKEKRNADAATLLRNALKDIDPIRQLMKPKICVETLKVNQDSTTGRSRNNSRNGRIVYSTASGNALAENSSEEVGVSYIFKMEFNREKYFKEFMPKLKAVLDQISVDDPKELRLSTIDFNFQSGSYRKKRDFVFQEFKNGVDSERGVRYSSYGTVKLPKGRNIFSYGVFDSYYMMSTFINGKRLVFECDGTDDGLGYYYSCHMYNGEFNTDMKIVNSDMLRDFRQEGGVKSGCYFFVLITEMNHRMTSGKANLYLLDKKTIDVMYEWLSICGEDRVYNVLFLDDQGNEISSSPWLVSGSVLMNISVSNLNTFQRRGQSFNVKNEQVVGMFYTTPFIGCAGDGLMQWLDFKFHKDDLPKIKQVRIEIAE